MNRALKILTGVGAGIAAAYFLDPKKGADRRASAMDKFNSLKKDPRGTLSNLTEGIREQAKNLTSDAKGLIGDGSNKIEATGQKDVIQSNQPFQTTH
ncbi:MAG: YtxH domain-containing protein [Pyrinomonadaceae bacterium]